MSAPFPYSGPAEFEGPFVAALRRIIDPEMAINIVDLGLVYGVEAQPDGAKVRLTMTSAACPVAELIVDDVVVELSVLMGDGAKVDAELVWDPPWSPERMSAAARVAMGWS
jgi:metal-sulfur cluster biosynthetic enzyme